MSIKSKLLSRCTKSVTELSYSMCTQVETEPILNGQCCNLTFTADFETCSYNYSCAVVKCQFVHRDPMGFTGVFPLTHFFHLVEEFGVN